LTFFLRANLFVKSLTQKKAASISMQASYGIQDAASTRQERHRTLALHYKWGCCMYAAEKIH
jgi:hypothetical protein